MSRIIIKNLPKDINCDELRERFVSIGEITDLHLKHSKDGKFRGFAFIGFKDDTAAQSAVRLHSGSYFGRNKVLIEAYDPSAISIKEKLSMKSRKTKEPSQVEKKSVKHEKTNIFAEVESDPKFKQFIDVQRNISCVGEKKKEKKYIWMDDVGVDDANNQEDEEEADAPDSQSTANSDVNHSSPSSKGKKREKGTPKHAPHTIKVYNLPFKCNKSQIREFFEPLVIKRVKTLPVKGFAFVSFNSEEDCKKACMKHKSFLGGKQVSITHLSTDDSSVQCKDNKDTESAHNSAPGKYHEITESVEDTGRLYVRNLSYACTSEDLETLFSPYGQLTEVYLPLDPHLKKHKGFAFVTFVFPEHAVTAMRELDKQIFQGRLLHILPGESKPDHLNHLNNLSSFRSKREEKLKQQSMKCTSWNTLFLNSNAIAEIMAEKFNVSKSNLIADSNTSDSIAVRMALGESQIVDETKQFLLNNGINLHSFEEVQDNATADESTNENEQQQQVNPAVRRINEKKRKARSKTVIVVKNLPAKIDSSTIDRLFSKFGTISRLVLPPYGVTAIVEMQESSEAKKAFDKLSNYKVNHTPIYLEWAPVNVFKNNVMHDKQYVDCSTNTQVNEKRKHDDDDHVHANEPSQALGEQQTVKRSKSTVSQSTCKPPPGFSNTKIVVRNVPFEGSADEVKELFSPFGSLKFVRLPLKMGGTGTHRGFAFVEFNDKHEAERAFAALSPSTHLYGRRLVLEWAKAETIES